MYIEITPTKNIVTFRVHTDGPMGYNIDFNYQDDPDYQSAIIDFTELKQDLVVTVKYENGAWTADHTYEQIAYAISQGVLVRLTDETNDRYAIVGGYGDDHYIFVTNDTDYCYAYIVTDDDAWSMEEVLEGEDGVGIASVTFNDDYTLTITLTNGDTYTSQSLRGAQGPAGQDGEDGAQGPEGPEGPQGVGIASTVLNADYTLTITLTNGNSYTTPSIRGAQGPAGQDGQDGQDGAAATIAVGNVSTSTGAAGTSATASVSNTGTSSAAVFDFSFSIPKGDKGDTGSTGPQGPAATIAVGSVSASTGLPGTSAIASVTNVGTSSAATFNFDFTIPSGSTGQQGLAGTMAIGSVSTSTEAPSTPASVTVSNVGTSSAAVLDFGFTIPKGDKGDTGATGPQGPAATVSIGSVSASTGLPGTSAIASVTNVGTSTSATFNFGFTIPSGATGQQGLAGTMAIGSVSTSTGAAGTSASVSVSNSGTSSAAVLDFDFTIPKGDTGNTGPAGPGVPTGGSAGQVLTKIDGTDYNTQWTTPKDIYWATYGTTTFAELTAAWNDGKQILCHWSNRVYNLIYVGTSFTFGYVWGTTSYRLACSAGSVWSNTSDSPVAPGTLDTTQTTSQTTSASEALSGNVKLHKISKTGDYGDLLNKPTIPAAQVNADWDAVSGVAEILNKPTIPAAQVNSDWDAVSGVAEILNKPTIRDPKMYIGTCPTAAATVKKVVSVDTFPTDGNGKPLVGTMIGVKFTNTNSATAPTLNVNSTGDISIYYNNAVASSTSANYGGSANRYVFYVYDGTYWVWLSYGTDANDNTIGYTIRTNGLKKTVSGACYRYRILFNSADGTKWVPANTSSSTNATSARTVNQTKIDPFGPIVYYSSTTALSSGGAPGASVLMQQYNGITLGYSFNRTGAALTLTSQKPVYIKCAPQTDGSAIIDADNPYVQDLPTTADGKIYILLGVATAATTIEMIFTHPIYYYSGGAIREWTNAEATGKLVTSISAASTDAEYPSAKCMWDLIGDVETLINAL